MMVVNNLHILRRFKTKVNKCILYHRQEHFTHLILCLKTIEFEPE